MDIAKALGDFLAFIDSPAILTSILFALVLPIFWKDGRRFLASTLAVSFACLSVGLVQTFNAAYRFAREGKLLEEKPAADFATSAIGFNGFLLPAVICIAFLALSWYLRRRLIAWFLAPLLAIGLSGYYGHLISQYWINYSGTDSPVEPQSAGRSESDDTPNTTAAMRPSGATPRIESVAWTSDMKAHVEKQCAKSFSAGNPGVDPQSVAEYCHCLFSNVYDKWTVAELNQQEQEIVKELQRSGVRLQCQLRSFPDLFDGEQG